MSDEPEPHAEAVAHAVAAHARLRERAQESARRILGRRIRPRTSDRWEPYQ